MAISRVIIIHGWGDDPTRGWINWLVVQLKARGIEAIAPVMPNPRRPDFQQWLGAIADTVGSIDEQTALIGHSLGCFMLLRFLEQYQGSGKLGKLILVAGFAVPADPAHQERFLPAPDFKLIWARVAKIYNVYSNNDHVVTPGRTRQLNNLLGGELVLDRDKRHFSGLRGIEDLPSVLNLVLDNT
jgi:predicted alpha/beta hydrolase family esterase